MPLKLLPFLFRAIALVILSLPLACTRSTPDQGTDSGGSVSQGGDASVTSGALGGSAGHGGVAGQSGDDLLSVPQGLSNTNVNGEDVGLTLVAFTLVQVTSGPKLYASVRNDGDTPACEAGMTTYFYDKNDQAITSSGSVLRSGRLYRMDDGTIISCVDPGQVAMAASTDLLASMTIDQLGYLKHLFPSFTVPGIVPIPGLSVSDLQTIVTNTGAAYTGNIINGLDSTVSAPSVTIFPVNRVGRPLGAAMATSSETFDLQPGGTWAFTTSAVDDPGANFVAYPIATIPN